VAAVQQGKESFIVDQQGATYNLITCEIDRTIMVITLNRPDKLNAYTGTMGSEIEDAFRRADVDDNVRAIIVTGAGKYWPVLTPSG
jgi:enoyl-CoA hydratase/carnithine racemase